METNIKIWGGKLINNQTRGEERDLIPPRHPPLIHSLLVNNLQVPWIGGGDNYTGSLIIFIIRHNMLAPPIFGKNEFYIR